MALRVHSDTFPCPHLAMNHLARAHHSDLISSHLPAHHPLHWAPATQGPFQALSPNKPFPTLSLKILESTLCFTLPHLIKHQVLLIQSPSIAEIRLFPPLLLQPKPRPIWCLTCMRARLLQSCPTLCAPIDHSLPGSSVHGILQARTLEWVAMPSSRGSSRLRGRTHVSYVSCLGRWALYQLSHWGPGPWQ